MANNTIASIVKQCCEDEPRYQEYSLQIVLFVKANQQNKDALKPIVDTVKQIIKDRKLDSPCKVLALKLLNQCFNEGGEDFIIYMEKKIMSRLAVLAKHKKDSNDLEKGAQLFGKAVNQRASSDFLKLLLLYIKQWATRFPMYSHNAQSLAGKQTEISKIYQSLVKDKVHFPSEEAVMQSMSSDYFLQQQSETVNSQFNPTSTAPQSQNQSMIAGPQLQNRGQFNTHQNQPTQSLNMSSISGVPGGRNSTVNTSQLDQSVRKSLNASLIMNQGVTLSKEEQIEIANKIKGDYKKLNEYQSTSKLVQEVMGMPGDNQVDDELVLSFRSQLIEGKKFAEGFLSTIIETPFTIRDRQSKIEKIMMIIGEIDEQLNKILMIKPLLKGEESKKTPSKVAQSNQSSSTSANIRSGDTLGSNQIGQLPQFAVGQTPDPVPLQKRKNNNFGSANNGEIKGILKTSKLITQDPSPPFQSNREPLQEGGFQDFKFDQASFKTNFALNPNANMNPKADFGAPQFNTDNPFAEAKKEQPQPNFMDFMALNQVSQPVDQFDFGTAFVQPVIEQVDIKHQVDIKKSSSNLNSDAKSLSGDKNQSSVNITPISRVSQSGLPNFVPDQKPKQMKKYLVKNASQMSLKSCDRSVGKEEEKKMGMIQKLSTNQPQITQRSPDSNPLSDGEDGGLLSSSNEKAQFNLPSSINESQLLRQSVTSRGGGGDIFNWAGDPSPDAIQVNKPESNRNSMGIGKGNNSSKVKQTFEKFDFSEIQNSQMSSRGSARQTKFQQQEQPSQELQDLRDEITKLRFQLSESLINQQNLDLQLKHQEGENDTLQSDMKHLKQYEYLYEEERLQRTQADTQNRALQSKVEEYKKMSERLEHKLNKSQKDGDTLSYKVKELEGALSQREIDMEDLRQSDAETKKQLQNELIECRKREEDLRIQLQTEIQDSKKRESYMKEQWLRDLQDKERSEEDWEKKCNTLENDVKAKDQEIERLKKQHTDFLAEQVAKESQKLVFKTKKIKFNKEPTQQTSNKSLNAVTEEVKQEDLTSLAKDNVFDFAFPNNDTSPQVNQIVESSPIDHLFTSVIKPQPQMIQIPAGTVNNFDATETFENKEVVQAKQSVLPEAEQIEISNYEETMGQVPSGDSDSPKGYVQQLSDIQFDEEESKSRKVSDNLLNFTVEVIKPEEKPVPSMDFDFPVAKNDYKPKDPFDFAALEEDTKVIEKPIFEAFDVKMEPLSLPAQVIEIKDNLQDQEKPNVPIEAVKIVQNLTPPKIQKKVEEDYKAPSFNIDDLLSGLEETKQKFEEKRKDSDPFAHITSELEPKPVLQQVQVIEKIQQSEIKIESPIKSVPKPAENVVLDKNQFSTMNTEQYQKQQQNEQTILQQVNPQALIQNILMQFFRKSLLTNKAVLYEDANIQIGLVSDYQSNMVRMRLFFGNKHQPLVQQIGFTQMMRPHGYQVNQSRDSIPQLSQGQQEPIDINIQIESYQLSIPVYNLNYRLPNSPPGQPSASLPVRLPMILLKLCSAIPSIDTPQQYINRWQSMPAQSESRQSFSIDMMQCRSLTQLKETLKLGRNAFAFVDGVEAQKNVVCGGTIFQGKTVRPLAALIKVTLTVDGNNCEIVGRSNDTSEVGAPQSEEGKFAKFIIGNVLELIARVKQ